MPHGQGRRPVAWLRFAAAGTALLACVFDAAALSSGPPRGTPLIGRPLQISIPVSWDRGETPPCVRADFLQGESPGGPLRWRLDQTSDGTGLLRLSSTVTVQEPVVTVQIALGCGQQFAREYVLLAEPPNDARDAQAAAEAGTDSPVALAPLPLASAPTIAAASPPETGARARAPAQGTALPAAALAPAATASGEAARAQPARRAPSAAPRPPATRAAAPQRREPAPRVAAAKAPPAEKRSGPRLKLEPIDVSIDEAPVLRLSSALTPPTPATTVAAAAATAGNPRALFQALNTSPEQQVVQAELSQALQVELRAMRELVQRYGAESRAATQRLEKVSAERDLMLNILVGLVAVLGGAFGYLLWLRSREKAAAAGWWEDEDGGSMVRPMKAPLPPARQPDLMMAPAPAPAPPPDPKPQPEPEAQAADSSADVDLVDLPDFSEFDQGRVLSVEELLGLKEKADFFLAVGQPEKALQLLESQLQEHTSSPFVWLDLLDLCRRLERREDYERLRVAFQKLFAARMPEFDAAIPESAGLEDHPRALSRITQLWGTTRVLKVIEDQLFEDPKPGSITFDLEASRDLLLLYGIATESLAAGVTRENFGGSYPSTVRAPLVAADATGTEPVPLAALDDLKWPASLLPPDAQPEPAQEPQAGTQDDPHILEWTPPPLPEPLPEVTPAPAAPAPVAAAAPDIDLGELEPLLPDDLDFSLSLPPAPPPERAP